MIAFTCAGDRLLATLDEAAGTTGLLIVSGGNEVRVGAHRGIALLAARLAADGVPVLRFDRRGVGDSEGSNSGFDASGPDIAAAAAAFRRAAPKVTRIVGFGNCDAASALALYGRAAGIDAVVLSNPWVVDPGDLPPAAAIRRRYVERLFRLDTWRRLASGGIDLSKAAKGLRALIRPEPQALADRIVEAIAGWGPAARVVVATGDATAIAFGAAASRRRLATPVERVDTPSHSFAGEAAAALETAIRRAL